MLKDLKLELDYEERLKIYKVNPAFFDENNQNNAGLVNNVEIGDSAWGDYDGGQQNEDDIPSRTEFSQIGMINTQRVENDNIDHDQYNKIELYNEYYNNGNYEDRVQIK